MNFKKMNPDELSINPFSLIGNDWMLITAGTVKSFNTMTASWGGLGVLWHKNVCFIFIRPQRYTFEFLDRSGTFTLCFFHEKYRDVLKYCGSKSGRDVNKVDKTGITPHKTKNGSVYFLEAEIVIECRKIYFHDIDPRNFLDPAIEEKYTDYDYHRMFIGEIISCMKKE